MYLQVFSSLDGNFVQRGHHGCLDRMNAVNTLSFVSGPNLWKRKKKEIAGVKSGLYRGMT